MEARFPVATPRIKSTAVLIGYDPDGTERIDPPAGEPGAAPDRGGM